MPSEAKSSTGETRVRELMQQRACEYIRAPGTVSLTFVSVQYIEKRDDFEIKVTKISKRLIHLVQEGDRVSKSKRFEEDWVLTATASVEETIRQIRRIR